MLTVWSRALTLAVATAGLSLNLRAWVLLGPHLHQRFGVGVGEYVALMGLPLLVAALVRLPVGVLTDRYGARVTFPAVSLATAAAVFGIGLGDSLPAVVAAGAAAGVAGAAFVVGASLVSRTVPYGRRGVALGVFTLGSVFAVVISAVSRGVDPDGRRAALVLGGLLVGFAGLAALVLRDEVAVRPATQRGTGAVVRQCVGQCVEMVRLASGTSLSVLYALALGGVVAIAVYLPVYLAAVFGLEWFEALAVTGAVVGLAAVARLVGGWWTDRRPTARLLTVCYAVAASLCLVVALAPPRWWVTAPPVAAIAVCDGVASGALLALIGKAARTDSVGAVMGVTGAVAAFGSLLLSLLMVAVDGLSHSNSAAWILLTGVLLAVTVYVRVYGLRIGLGLAVRGEPAPSPTAMTVAVVGESDTRWGAVPIVARLAELAASDELVVVYGSDEPQLPRLDANVLLVGLRDRLPRHSVVALRVGRETGGRLAGLFGEFVEAGAVAIAVAHNADVRGVAAELSSYLHADRVLTVSYTREVGAHVDEVWNRLTDTGP